MYIVTLLTSPATPSLSREAVEALRNAWGGGDAQWLAVGEAAEFVIGEKPSNLWDVWQAMQAEGIDLIVLPMEGRKKKMLLADMDSTMIQQECIDELAAEAGVGPRVAEITAKAMNGELDFEGAIDERVGLLKDLPESIIDHVLKTRIDFMLGGKALVQTMKANGGYAALVSGGFTAFTAKVASELGFDENRANTLEVSDGKLTGRVVRPILGREAKLEALDEITARLGITREDVLAVGDGMNDLLMLKNAGTGVALHGKPALQEQCDVRINHGDLTALLYVQGYSKAEFV
ncbi:MULTISPECIES: phosphoserine phosphatase SerB [Pacificibacter]|uniref:phosphoserine phosphatase SerB n=1 Tax=Pacificibacter TaxID=1042323 RepID=UPI001C080B61|nr:MULTISPECIES: phosphoserine phosphatase SerB [Pacificibacter]MBU2937216.1 phosphoserine phosphatase SerB [Pacificibacter marinus]MDO6615211.1 phosphoserine phosphatase SerB [Pacificibacter sp. 1_MG-2023]